MTEEKIYCETPTEGKAGTHIPRWKYSAVRDAILAAVDAAGCDGLAFKELPEAVKGHMKADDLARLGSVSWHVTTVKLDMEVKGELKRIAGTSPQRLVLA